MNEIHSQRELKYKRRWLAPQLQEASKDHPIIVLTGARQVGKSTLLKNELPFANWKHLTLDDFDVLTQAQHDPAALWAGTDEIVLDEVQKSAHLLEIDLERSGFGNLSFWSLRAGGSANLAGSWRHL